MKTLTVTIPPGRAGDVEIRQFEVNRMEATLSAFGSAGRGGTPPGTYTGLYRQGRLWMSDTPTERRDHLPVLYAASGYRAERAIINGLGLGMIVGGLLAVDTMRHIDVVEIDPDVIALVGPHYQAMAEQLGKTVTVHLGDAYTISWPAGTRWDLAWHDIWQHLCLDNLPQMARLHRRYGRRVRWQESWGRDLLQAEQRRERRRPQWW